MCDCRCFSWFKKLFGLKSECCQKKEESQVELNANPAPAVDTNMEAVVPSVNTESSTQESTEEKTEL